MKKVWVRVWDKNAHYIGEFHVPQDIPEIVNFGEYKTYQYNKIWHVYTEAEVYETNLLKTSDVKTKQP